MRETEGPERFSESQRAELDVRRLDQDRTLAAIHRLEAALGSAAPRRESQWREEVLGALAILDQATTGEAHNADRPDSLLSDIARTQPRLRNRVRGVRTQYHQLRQKMELLRRELERHDHSPVDFAEFRQRVSWAMTALRHQRARESDLIYEAYYEAFKVDLGQEGGDGQERPV